MIEHNVHRKHVHQCPIRSFRKAIRLQMMRCRVSRFLATHTGVVLQELYPVKARCMAATHDFMLTLIVCLKKGNESRVNDCNTWFYVDIYNLQAVFSECGLEIPIVGELWLGLLKFYAEEFNLQEHVVSI